MKRTIVGGAMMLAAATVAGCGGGSDGPGPGPGGASVATCNATDPTVTPLALDPGGVRLLCNSSSYATLQLAGAAPLGAEYLVVTANGNPTLDVLASYRVTSSAAGSATTSPALASGIAAAAPRGQWADDLRARATKPHHEVQTKLQEWTRANLRPAGPRAAGARTPSALRTAQATAVPTVGQTIVYRVPRADRPCTNYDSVSAVVRAVSARSIVLQDATAPTGGFTDMDFAAIAAEFDAVTYPVDVDYFGTPTDDDVNERVVILFTPKINALTPKGSTTGFTAGFFFAGDLFPRRGSAETSCLQSNESELFYLLVPDPTGTVSIPQSTRSVRELTRGTIAHEFEHMINAGRRISTGASAFEASWLDEGLAHFAEEAVGRAVRGFGDRQKLTYANVFDAANGGRDFDAFFEQNLVRFRRWLLLPDTAAGPSSRTETELAERGAAWALVRHTADHFSGGNVRGFTRALVTGPQVGIDNLSRRAGVPYDSVFGSFMVANYVSGLNVPGLPERYDYASWNMRDAVGAVSGGSYPLAVNELRDGSTYTKRARSHTGSYFHLTTLGTANVRFLSPTSSNGASFAGAREWVVRLR